MGKREHVKGVKKEGVTVINLSEKTISIIDKSECKNCYHVAECFINLKSLNKCEKWLDTKKINKNKNL